MIEPIRGSTSVAHEPSVWRALYANRYLSWTRRKAARFIKPLLPKSARWVKIRGGILEGSFICAELRHGEKSYWLGAFEPEIQSTLQMLSRQNRDLNCVYDVGAHIGFHSMAFARCFPRARVIAFEPNPRNYERLKLNIQRNALAGRTTLLPQAVSDRSEEAQFYLGESTWSGGLVRQHRDNYSLNLNVLTTTLDDVVFRQAFPPPELIKIDAEGAEAQVIRGGMQVLREHKPAIIAELHHAETAPEVLAALVNIGYEIEPLGDEETGYPGKEEATGHFLAAHPSSTSKMRCRRPSNLI